MEIIWENCEPTEENYWENLKRCDKYNNLQIFCKKSLLLIIIYIYTVYTSYTYIYIYFVLFYYR